MKKGIVFYIEDDADLIGFCGTLCTKKKNSGIKGVTCFNLDENAVADYNEWFIPVCGKAIEIGDNKESED